MSDFLSPKVTDEDFRLGRFRVVAVWLGIAVLAAFLVGRLLWIQVLHPERLIAASDARVVRNYYYEPPRGLITDRQGRILAISVPVKSVDADPKLLHESGVATDPKRIARLAAILEQDPQDLEEKISDPGKRFVHLKRYLELKDAKTLKSLGGDGIILHDSYRRFYPTGTVNSTLVGILNGEGEGVYGVEQSFNSYLSSTETKQKARKDRYDRVVENLEVLQQGNAGGNLMLSVDDRLQSAAFQSLREAVLENKAQGGTLVMIDVLSGEILAMVSYPAFDPNERSHFDSDHAQNRAVSDIFEPGSTLKPIVSLSALENRVATWNKVFDTRPFSVDGKMVRDSHFMETGTLKDIIKYSSNTAMAHMAMKLGPHKVLEMLRRFGFGERSQSGLVGESPGRLNEQRPFWADIDVATLGFGYGVAVTTLQLAQAYATLANGGRRVPVSALKVSKPGEALQAADAKDVRRMQQALETVVTEGTGTQAAIGRYRVAGKTGTAKIAGRGGYDNRYISTFAGFAPLSQPRFALVVAIKDPRGEKYYGGAVSGPVFRDVMSRALQLYNVAPDKKM